MAHPILAKVEFWDDIDNKMATAVHILNAYSFTQAAEQLESYYGDNLESINLDMYEEGLITFPVESYETLKHILSGENDENEETAPIY